MVTVIKKGDSKAHIRKVLEKVQETSNKGMDAFKYCGTVKFTEDGLTLQKQWRDEWK